MPQFFLKVADFVDLALEVFDGVQNLLRVSRVNVLGRLPDGNEVVEMIFQLVNVGLESIFVLVVLKNVEVFLGLFMLNSSQVSYLGRK